MASSFRPTDEQLEQFLYEIGNGRTRQEAAEAVGSTASRFRTYINGKSEESLAFAKRYVEALEQSGNAPSPYAGRIRELEQVHLAHRLLDEFITRALDTEKKVSPSANRLLYQLSLLNVESFKPLLEARTRHIHEGQVGVYAMPQIDTSKWTLEQHEEFVALEERRSALIAIAQPDMTPAGRALPSPARDDSTEIVEDAQFEEIEETAVA